ncbi:polysaccharide biosynthesis tyrosine autokinase [filamentous cyanobacterium LEGE 11480]|uniref:non-specific protein-tyrosine kinase n=1 Tax=Romeriopsis navalis LEGE 11480 TaxID=2777977 RepID=A0A928VPN5_9CYAN|nr:polysaccharide biosynthesis tyrosine autokinase [Romeriopsis navalis]MBE9030596.1 polysaccharide biosynthesis tyrosine autokinase [Romeriopsis navalis LEGE 11480]
MQSSSTSQDYVDLQQVSQSIRRRWLPASLVFGAVLGATFLITSVQKPIYQSQGKLRFDKDDRASSLAGLSQEFGGLSGLTNSSNPLQTESEIIKSEPLLQKTIQQLQLKDKTEEDLEPEDLLKRLQIKVVRGTDILAVSYRSTDPQEAATVVNQLISNYLDHHKRTNRAEAVAARKFITKQLPEVETRVLVAEQSLRQFKEENQIVALDEEAKIVVSGLNQLTDRLTATRTELASVTSKMSVLGSRLGVNAQTGIALTALSQSEAVQQSLREYRQVQDNLVVQQTRYQDEHPAVQKLQRKAAALKSQLRLRVNQVIGSPQTDVDGKLNISKLEQSITADLVNLEAERLGLRNRLSVLTSAMGQSQQRANVLPQLEQNQRELERRLHVARSTYEELLKRLQEVQIIENQNIGNVQIVANANIPKKSVSPKLALNLLLGGFIAVALSAAMIWLLESLDNTVKDLEEAKRIVDYPVLGQIPTLTMPTTSTLALPLREATYSPANVAFEMLQTNLGFTLTDKALKVITITSSLPNEGKSFVAANLAIATAQMGKRVLLIDADMRCPTQHTAWELHNLKGLSDVLVGQADVMACSTKVMSNLHVLTAGTIPPNPTALLNSQGMRDLIAVVSDAFDFVIIDTPPVSVVADGLLTGQLSDGVMLVVRPGTVNTKALAAAQSALTHSGETVLGVAFNGVKTKMTYGGYYYIDRYQQPHTALKPHLDEQLPDSVPAPSQAETVLRSLMGAKKLKR